MPGPDGMFDGDTPFAILAFTVVFDRVITIDIFSERERELVVWLARAHRLPPR